MILVVCGVLLVQSFPKIRFFLSPGFPGHGILARLVEPALRFTATGPPPDVHVG